MPSLPDQVVIVTGASAGIGEATADRLAHAGARVVLCARRADRLAALALRLDPKGERVLAIPGDVTVEADRRRVVEETMRRFGRIDALVNNAGFGQRGPLEVIPIEAIRRNFETNVFSLLALTQLVAPIMRAQGHGRIVNISSVAGRIARPLSSVYDATKHALEALSDGLRGELKPFGVQVVVIRPGFIVTDFIAAANDASASVMSNLGPYAPFLPGIAEGVKKLRRLAGPPDAIAKLVERALTAPHPKTHYAGPMHAKVFLALNWLLPRWVIDWIGVRGNAQLK